jgi:hypothetical protein
MGKPRGRVSGSARVNKISYRRSAAPVSCTAWLGLSWHDADFTQLLSHIKVEVL